ncbi:hypothetical protein AB2F75_24260 (plasmid) [Escherichia coli]
MMNNGMRLMGSFPANMTFDLMAQVTEENLHAPDFGPPVGREAL